MAEHRARRRANATQTDRSTLQGVSPQRAKERTDLAGAPRRSPTGTFSNFIYRGGAVINTPRLFALFIGDWASAANQTRATRLGQFMTDLMSSRYMNILSQYGCGTSGTLVSSSFIASTDHDLSGGDIQTIVQNAITAGTVPEPTDQATCYILFLDDATAVNDGSIVMCEPTSDTAFGFHDVFTTTAGNLAAFSVIPGLTDACLRNSCANDGTCSLHLAQTREARQTQVVSHELAEMFSDPHLDAWFDPNGNVGENGDICNGQAGTLTVGANSWTVQQMYSKSHDMTTNGATTCVTEVANPLPSLLPAVSVVLDRSTFGKDEVDALLHLANPGRVSAAFYVAVDGFRPVDLGITAASLTGVPSVTPTLSFNPPVTGMTATATSLVAEDPSLGGGIQRFTWEYAVDFTSSAGFPVAIGDVATITVTASASRIPAPVVSASGQALMQLVHEPNPYELDGPVSWLSTDLRVFQLQENQSRFGAAAIGTGANAAPVFIQDVLDRLNDGTTGGETFDDITPDQTASQLELSEKVNNVPVYNFAVAKVRYRALAGDATNVRVFFRLFPVSTASTDYHQNTVYPRGGSGGTVVPVLGIQAGEVASIPCFAELRVASDTVSLDAQTDAKNVRTLNHDGSGNEVTAYFGCWLDINQTAPQFPLNPAPAKGPWPSGRLSVQQLMRGHQCLVAEIAFDPDPIPDGVGPGGSDKLAQRNLALVQSDNPGAPASHLIPAPFEVRPTSPKLQGGLPDELLIDWRDVPQGSTATMFVPGLGAKAIVELADEVYASHHLTALDDHTLAIGVQGLTYVPLPIGTGPNVPGLLSVQLPDTVRKGQHFTVVVRQLTAASGAPPIVIGTADELVHWRQVLGSYQVSIPVLTKNAILAPEERLLSVLRWIELSIPTENRWHTVFVRYVDQIAERVRALGGNPDAIEPSPDGSGHHPQPHPHPHRPHCVTGKVCEVLFDCFGDLEAFVLDDCHHRHVIGSREERVGDLAVRAMRHGLRLTAWLAPEARELSNDREDDDRHQRHTCGCGTAHGHVTRVALAR
jgi:hypothetical protein